MIDLKKYEVRNGSCNKTLSDEFMEFIRKTKPFQFIYSMFWKTISGEKRTGVKRLGIIQFSVRQIHLQ